MCGERKLATLTEAREPRYLLDQVWAEEGVRRCLEEGQWNFAMRAVQVDYDPAVSPAFGYTRGFSKPTDWIRTAGLCSDEGFRTPLLQYVDELDYWYAYLDTIYVRYVSNDSSYGQDMSKWPITFAQYVAAYFASEVIIKISSDKERYQLVMNELRRRKRDALNKDAMNDPTTFPAKGSWVRARDHYGWRRDGGNSGSLIG
jgi:hypothetical protein